MRGLQDDEKALFERMVNDAMRVFGYGRPKAEKLVKGVIPRIRHQAQIQKERQKKATRKKKVNGSQKRCAHDTRGNRQAASGRSSTSPAAQCQGTHGARPGTG